MKTVTKLKEKHLTVIGTVHKKQQSRIWIEGNRLVEAGFTVGQEYTRMCFGGENPSIHLHIHRPGLAYLGRIYKVSGKGDKPIIDISGAVVREVFQPSGDDADVERQVVEVVYEQGFITISRPEEAAS